MTFIYLFDGVGLLTGPVEIPVIPGLGRQLPGNAIALPQELPPPQPDHAWALVNGEVQEFQDHRGRVYNTETGEPEQYDQLGALPSHLAATARPSAAHFWKNGTWIKDPASTHWDKTTEINAACTAAITGGFISPALGEPHQYSSELDDQLNLTGVILRAADSLYACRDAAGIKIFRPHTALELRQVGDDFTVFKLTLLQQANSLKQQLDQALAMNDLEALEAVTWKEPQP